MNDRDKLIVDNMNLVYYVLHRYYPKRYSYDEDLVQCGMIGLCEAADRYNPELGKFSSFACQGIRNKIGHELKNRKKCPDQISLSKPIAFDDDDEVTLEDTLPSDDDVSYVVGEQMLSVLTPEEQTVVQMRRDGNSFKEIGEVTGHTHEGVRYICKRIKNKWRKFV